jgi:hypothetical protein
MILAAGLALARSVQSNFHGCHRSAIEVAGNHNAHSSMTAPNNEGGTLFPAWNGSQFYG